MRVLVCDDEPDVRLLFRVAFERAGADVDEAVDGLDCLDWLDAHDDDRPDLIVLDLYMPRCDGFAALRQIHERWPAVPVIIVSAHASVDVFGTGRQLGATACFPKPSFVGRIPGLVARYAA